MLLLFKTRALQRRLGLKIEDNIESSFCTFYQWLNCNGTQGNAVPLPPIYSSKRSPTSDRYNARERHTTIVTGPNLNVAFPHL